jgi:hypothetical protein
MFSDSFSLLTAPRPTLFTYTTYGKLPILKHIQKQTDPLAAGYLRRIPRKQNTKEPPFSITDHVPNSRSSLTGLASRQGTHYTFLPPCKLAGPDVTIQYGQSNTAKTAQHVSTNNLNRPNEPVSSRGNLFRIRTWNGRLQRLLQAVSGST